MKRAYYELVATDAVLAAATAGAILANRVPVPQVFITMGIVFASVYLGIRSGTEPEKDRRQDRPALVTMHGAGRYWEAEVKK